ncbi:acyl carrier protein [Tistrella mobilis]|jgi:acyl carrier protein|uniref:Acyl carrier protein n=1 Tax=Tistrella mobilis TaxID=171437 RepID=A0A162JW18_9PROT|nr:MULTISPECIES: acyl carrier protein [Tistrella]KYO49986.1 phosphopantetheine-binding protein [Tistrella mobilis]MAD39127.1 phosphopantetheine-binding protein [Tistrella sp.]HAE46856.1 acyl carrier protein [Tistrella mobilis]
MNTQTTLPGAQQAAAGAQAATRPDAAAIEAWLVDYLADRLGRDRSEIRRTERFERMGVDSLAVVSMTGELEEWLGRKVEPTLAYDHPTVQDLAAALAG